MSERKNGTRRMPRGLAIIICYIVFLAAVTGFMFLLVPRLSSDIARIGKEAPGLYKRINEEWTPELARWLEQRFPSLARRQASRPRSSRSSRDVPLPPGTALTMTPLPDGRFAVAAHAERRRHQADARRRLPPAAARDAARAADARGQAARATSRSRSSGCSRKLNDVRARRPGRRRRVHPRHLPVLLHADDRRVHPDRPREGARVPAQRCSRRTCARTTT